MMGKRGIGGLYIITDILVAIAVFTLLYIGTDEYLRNHTRTLTGSHSDPTTLIETTVGNPWGMVPIGFLLSIVVSSIYGREWANVKSMLRWMLILGGLFVFNIFYIGTDYYITDVFPGLISGDIVAADNFLSTWMIPMWNVLPWIVHLGIMFWGIFYIERTPEGQYVQR